MCCSPAMATTTRGVPPLTKWCGKPFWTGGGRWKCGVGETRAGRCIVRWRKRSIRSRCISMPTLTNPEVAASGLIKSGPEGTAAREAVCVGRLFLRHRGPAPYGANQRAGHGPGERDHALSESGKQHHRIALFSILCTIQDDIAKETPPKENKIKTCDT